MQERGGSLRIHAGALHFPTARCVGPRPMTRGRVASGSRLMAPVTARSWVVFPTPA